MYIKTVLGKVQLGFNDRPMQITRTKLPRLRRDRRRHRRGSIDAKSRGANAYNSRTIASVSFSSDRAGNPRASVPGRICLVAGSIRGSVSVLVKPDIAVGKLRNGRFRTFICHIDIANGARCTDAEAVDSHWIPRPFWPCRYKSRDAILRQDVPPKKGGTTDRKRNESKVNKKCKERKENKGHKMEKDKKEREGERQQIALRSDDNERRKLQFTSPGWQSAVGVAQIFDCAPAITNAAARQPAVVMRVN